MAYFADRFQAALKNGGRALIVGVFPKDMPAEYREHPRLLYWDTDSPQLKTCRIDELPVRVRVVVATRWISHAVGERLQMLARRQNVLYMGKLASTGEMAKMLNESIPLNATPVAAAVDIHKEAAALTPVGVEPEPPPIVPELFPTAEPGHVFSTVTDCVRFYTKREIERPLPAGRTKAPAIPDSYFEQLAQRVTAHGWDTDPIRARGLFSNLRSVHRARLEREREIEEIRRTAAAEVVSAVPAQPAAPVAPLEPLPADLERIVAMADELEIKAITAIEVADQLRRIVKEHRELRETKEKYDAMMAVMHGGKPSTINGSGTAAQH